MQFMSAWLPSRLVGVGVVVGGEGLGLAGADPDELLQHVQGEPVVRVGVEHPLQGGVVVVGEMEGWLEHSGRRQRWRWRWSYVRNVTCMVAARLQLLRRRLARMRRRRRRAEMAARRYSSRWKVRVQEQEAGCQARGQEQEEVAGHWQVQAGALHSWGAGQGVLWGCRVQV